MTGKDFVRKLFDTYVWGHIAAIAIVIAMLSIGVKYGVAAYTHHGETLVVPNVVGMQLEKAEEKMAEAGLQLVVQDTNYVKTMPPDCVLEQTPGKGKRIKSTHVVYVTINAANPPALTMPDLADNSSYREARATLLSMGFKSVEAQYVPGEKDWVYAITVNGRQVEAGERVSSAATIIIQVGDGMRSASDTTQIGGPQYEYEEVEEQRPEYEEDYEYIEVPIDEVQPGDEIISGDVPPQQPTQRPADPQQATEPR